MHYLITGGAGFIGSHLAEALLQQGDKVTVLDDLSTGSMSNIDLLKSRPRFRYRIDDMLNSTLLPELVDDCDVIYHLAAAVGVRLIVESPVRTIQLNVRGTERVLDFANKKRRKIILASTSEVYGKSKKIPFREDDDLILGPPTKGRWSYACSKAIDEFLALAYWKERKQPVVIARLFNTVGPRQTGQYGMVVPTFVKQALRGDPLTVFGNGLQRRCFTHVKDTVRALARIPHEPKAVGQVINIGSQNEISILALAKWVKKLTGSSSTIRKIPYDEAYEEGFEDMERRIPDITKARKLLGYRPTFGIQEILMDVIKSMRSFNS